MALFEPPRSTEALDRLLATEREALLSGQLEDLAPLVQEKLELLTRLERDGARHKDLGRLKRAGERNQRLLAAAARGIEAARNRLAVIQTGPQPMRTYARDGAASDIEPVRRTGVNRRA